VELGGEDAHRHATCVLICGTDSRVVTLWITCGAWLVHKRGAWIVAQCERKRCCYYYCCSRARQRNVKSKWRGWQQRGTKCAHCDHTKIILCDRRAQTQEHPTPRNKAGRMLAIRRDTNTQEGRKARLERAASTGNSPTGRRHKCVLDHPFGKNA